MRGSSRAVRVKIYLAGGREATADVEGISHRGGGEDIITVWTTRVKRRLFSFYYHGFSGGTGGVSRLGRIAGGSEFGLTKAIQDARRLGWECFLDSGAFTAFTQNKQIGLREYADYIKKTKETWSACSSLDAIGSGIESARETYRNFAKLRDLGAEVQPVFHVREPDLCLKYYVDAGWDYILIGGMVPETSQWLKVRLDGLWDSILTYPDGTPRVRTHGFGLTDQSLMFRYPWYSIDSTAWLMTGIFGACMFRVGRKVRKVVFSEESPEARKFAGWHYDNLPMGARAVVDSWCDEYGVYPEQLKKSYVYRDIINAATYQGLEDLATDRFTLEQEVLFA